MKKSALVLGVASFGVAAIVTSASAIPDAKLQASKFQSSLVQAMDACSPGVTTVGGLEACAPGNTATDGTPFNTGKVLVKSTNGPTQVLTILKSSAATPADALAGKVVNTRLVLRVTQTDGATPITWEDITLNCPSATVGASGNVVMKNSLQQCGLGPVQMAEKNSKEIVSASVVDNGSGKAIATAGVRKKP